MPVQALGHTFPNLTTLSRYLYVSPSIANTIANVSPRTITRALKSGFLEGYCQLQPKPPVVTIQALAAWKTARDFTGTLQRNNYTIHDYITACNILPLTVRRYAARRVNYTRRALQLVDGARAGQIRIVLPDTPAGNLYANDGI